MTAQTQIVKYQSESGEVALSHEIIKKYLVNGQSQNVTDSELEMFLQLCKYRRLNPFLREAYLIKYGTDSATIVVGVDLFTARAARMTLCDGWQSGIFVRGKDGKIDKRVGSMLAPDETLLGGWCSVYRKDWQIPMETSVALNEFMRYKANGEPMKNWRDMPATMIEKVAKVKALRAAFPEELGGMYTTDEMPVDTSTMPTGKVMMPQSEPAHEPQEPEPIDATVTEIDGVPVGEPPPEPQEERPPQSGATVRIYQRDGVVGVQSPRNEPFRLWARDNRGKWNTEKYRWDFPDEMGQDVVDAVHRFFPDADCDFDDKT